MHITDRAGNRLSFASFYAALASLVHKLQHLERKYGNDTKSGIIFDEFSKPPASIQLKSRVRKGAGQLLLQHIVETGEPQWSVG